MTGATAASTTVADRARRKISRRILPYFFLLYIVAYLDRANVAFAKLSMIADLKFSEAVFGLGAGVFFMGYFLLEIPGALIVERWSARLWIARILATWGLFTVLVGFVRTPMQFYVTRFLLGVAEAGFFPGAIVYFTHWFPARDRARAMSSLVLAVPLSFVLGAPISAWCLSIGVLGFPGWRWIFILQGLPAILFGLITPFYLADHPHQAAWLTPEERGWVTSELERERQSKRSAGHSILQALTQRSVLTLAAALFLIVLASYGYVFWLPSMIQKACASSISMSTLLSACPFAVATISVRYMGRSSDRRSERKLHTAVPLILAGVFFALTTVSGQPFPLTMTWLCLTGLTLWAWAPSFWVLPTVLLGESAAAASVGFINSIGNLGGFAGPAIVGALLEANHSYAFAVIALSIAFWIAAALILTLPLRPETS
jgi:ACS family tartrate transporter-like MFS transporter